jgi:hypothetical protein
MKMLAEYLEKAIQFETMAGQEKDPKLRAELEKQALAYRKLAVRRAKEYKLDQSKNEKPGRVPSAGAL